MNRSPLVPTIQSRRTRKPPNGPPDVVHRSSIARQDAMGGDQTRNETKSIHGIRKTAGRATSKMRSIDSRQVANRGFEHTIAAPAASSGETH